jgi:hypothetical protein
MPPRTPQRRPQVARSRGGDPTVSIASAAAAKTQMANETEALPETQQKEQKQQANDDLKKLIETLKNKLGNGPGGQVQKKVPPQPSRPTWNRSIEEKQDKNEAAWKPAYTILTRISNHEKVPVKNGKPSEVTVNSLPHSFIYKPGVDGIKVDKLQVKPGKQICMG